MAVSWPFATTMPRPHTSDAASTRTTDRALGDTVARVREVVLSPVTALVAMFVGLALLFVLPLVGLPFVALVVLPATVYHLQTDRRPRYDARRR